MTKIHPVDQITKISELNGKTFTVEDYQRGYKWTKQQVRDLLNDVKDFVDDEKNEGKVYCLQPIVIIEKENKECELVDGQQRLTTVFIILSYLDECRFTINYNTRKGSNTFLNEIIVNKDIRLLNIDWESFIKENPELNNVDNYHFFCSYNYIHDWFEEKDNTVIKNATFFLERLGVIYYLPEITNEQTPEKIFININSNKIELTNAELIKGILIINGAKEKDTVHNLYKQLEVAKEWDKIEKALHNDQLWYFLNPQKTYRNRIEYLFELYESIYVKNIDLDKKDTYFLFHALNNNNLNHVWSETIQIFNIITDWFNDANLEMYHFVGYVIASNLFSITMLIELWNSKNKDSFLLFLKTEILNKIGDDEKIKKASFKKSKNDVILILLIHNILSLRQKVGPNLLEVNWTSKFRFDLYIYEEWSLEHIHAQNEAPQDTFEKLKPWIVSTIHSLIISNKWNSNLEEFNDLKVISDCANVDEWGKITGSIPKLSVLNSRIVLFQEKISVIGVDKHRIENLALLSKSINSSIGNGYFDEKRVAVIECDKKGKYLLPTTKNVFLKFYSKEVSNPYEWGDTDKNAYLDDIVTKISCFRREIYK